MEEILTLKETKKVNPYIENIFGKWFKNIILLFLVIFGIIFGITGAIKGWIDATFGLQVFFLIMGIILGKWLEHG